LKKYLIKDCGLVQWRGFLFAERFIGVEMINNIILLLIIGMAFVGCDSQEKSADIILIAPAYTMDTKQPWAEAVAIKGDKIIFVGDDHDVRLYQNSTTHVIEVPNGMVLPGFIDSHVHLLWGGIEMNECHLHDMNTSDQIFQNIRDYLAGNPDVEWLRGSGWYLPIFTDGNPRKEWLDEICPDKPVFLLSLDGHSAWVNSKALELAGIDANTTDPSNGRIERDPKTKEPSGVLREDAMGLVEDILPGYTKDQIDAGLEIAFKEANRFGITAILDAGTELYSPVESSSKTYDGLDSYREATLHKKISMRVAASQYARPEFWKDDLTQMKKRRFANELGIMNTVKIFADGVIEGGTAALLEPYLGTDDRGILNWHPDTLKKAVAEYDKEGFQIHVHAIGDWGIRSTLDAFEFARQKNGLDDKRHMMSHIQLIHPQDVPRFKELNIIASFQALWAYPDKYITDLTLPVLGPVRSRWNYPINSVVLSGGRIAGGSDWTVSSLNPLDAIEVAVTRREPGNKDGDTLSPEEAVKLETMLRAYTLEGAFSLFKENEIGSLEADKLADIIILDRNLFQIPAYEIHNASVVQTIFNGKIIYKKEEVDEF
jgi:hypothetical protein